MGLKRIWLVLLLIAAPSLLGGLGSMLVQAVFRPVPVLVFKVDVGTVMFVAGILVTALAGAIYIGTLMRDRRAQEDVDAAFREAERSRNRFLRRLDHEIKNPLTGLQAALANLRETVSLPERERAARNADRAVERLARLLADLRKLSDLAERPLEKLPVDIPKLLEEMIDAAHSQPAYGERPITLMITRVPWHLPPVTGDRDLLGLAIYNLIENALKFTSEQDSVEVRALEDREDHYHRSRRYRTGYSSGRSEERIRRALQRDERARSRWQRAGLGIGTANCGLAQRSDRCSQPSGGAARHRFHAQTSDLRGIGGLQNCDIPATTL